MAGSVRHSLQSAHGTAHHDEKIEAIEEEIPVLQPEDPNSAEFVEVLKGLGADVSVVVAYGRILSEEVIECEGREGRQASYL